MSRVVSVGSYALTNPREGLTERQKLAVLGPFAERWGNVPKGTVLPSTHVLACPKVKVSELPRGHLPTKYFEVLEHNQKIASCCRHPENHEIEAFKSHPDEQAPDIYIFHCTCGRKHRRFCVGYTDDVRPFWAVAVDDEKAA